MASVVEALEIQASLRAFRLASSILGNAVTQKLWDRVLELLCNAAKLA